MNSEKTIIVTGASSGIGRETARFLLDEGYRVIVTARSEDKLKDDFSADENAVILPWDLSDVNQVIPYTKKVKEIAGPISGFVHCAAAGINHIVSMIKPDLLQRHFDVNVYAAMLLTAGFAKKNMVTEDASFILISSISAHAGTQGQSIYSATKGALEGFIKGSAYELSQKGIRINAIAPGMVLTEPIKRQMQKIDEEGIRNIENGYPFGLGEPRDISNMIEFLFSDKSKWITGQTFIVDGGFMIRKP